MYFFYPVFMGLLWFIKFNQSVIFSNRILMGMSRNSVFFSTIEFFELETVTFCQCWMKHEPSTRHHARTKHNGT